MSYKRPSWVTLVAIILWKDIKQYYAKAPVISWGFLFPLTLATLLGYYGSWMGAWRIVPGVLAVALLFAASSMAQVVMSFDKMSGGIMMLVSAPIPGSAIVAGKSLGGIVMGLGGSGAAAMILYALTGRIPIVHPWFLVAGLVLGSLIFTFMALALAVVLEPLSAVAGLNFLRFSMVFLGGLLPAPIIPGVLKPLVYVLPMAYVSDLIRYGLFNTYEFVDPYTSIIAAVMYLAAIAFIAIRTSLDALIP